MVSGFRPLIYQWCRRSYLPDKLVVSADEYRTTVRHILERDHHNVSIVVIFPPSVNHLQADFSTWPIREHMHLGNHHILLTSSWKKSFIWQRSWAFCFIFIQTSEGFWSWKTPDKPFQGSFCYMDLSWTTFIVMHKITHTEQKSFQCSHYDKLSHESYHIQIHQWTHTGVKQFQCSRCDKHFSRIYSLQIATPENVHYRETYFNSSIVIKLSLSPPEHLYFLNIHE